MHDSSAVKISDALKGWVLGEVIFYPRSIPYFIAPQSVRHLNTVVGVVFGQKPYR